MPESKWYCFQRGAREHYAIPRALAARKRLERFVTDGWSGTPCWRLLKPAFTWNQSLRRFSQRSHPDLYGTPVSASNLHWMGSEFRRRFFREDDPLFHSRENQYFDFWSTEILKKDLRNGNAENVTLFAFANACLELFKFAKERGAVTILGQFDPGPAEARIVQQEHDSRPEFNTQSRPYPNEYFERWWQEVKLSDRLVVNSEWSRICLVSEGADPNKVTVIPLADVPPPKPNFHRTYPACFDHRRPLRILFLGQVILRKGIARLFDAVRLLRDQPVIFTIVGPTDILLLDTHCKGLPVNYHGPCSRLDTLGYFEKSDVFLLPTLSDGFALTLLEAQSWSLPIIVSKRCGQVVEDEINGLVLEEPTGEVIALAIQRILDNPSILTQMAKNSKNPAGGINAIAEGLLTTERFVRA